MKQSVNSLSVLFLLLFLWGCQKDLLNTIPNDRISTEIFWKTETDAVLAANAVYTYMAEDADHFIGWDCMSDIVFTNPTGPQEASISQGQFNALNSRISGDWTRNYAGIRAANSFLANVDKIEVTDPALIDRLKGEVRALRSYFYYQLVFLFGDVPLVTSELTVDESRRVTRDPAKAVWDFVASELDAAAAVLPVKQSDVGRFTKGAALALKARAMLYAGRWQEAADAARQVMDLGVYSLLPSYKTLFSYQSENSPEVILDIQYVQDVYSNSIFQALAPRSVNANSKWVPTKKIVDAYEMKNGAAITDPGSGYDPADPYKNRDPRLQYSVFVPGDSLPNGKIFNSLPDSKTGDAVGSSFVVSPTGFNVKKYVNKEDLAHPGNCGINLILIRYAEVLLTFAEAKTELNQLDEKLYDALNKVRQRADVNQPAITTGKSQAQLQNIIRHERMVELAFEGQRFFDIRRWKIAGEVMPGKVYGITYKDDQGQLQTIEVPGWTQVWDNKNYLWPVPQKERELNTNLTQNPGW
ncbi:carbohydrate-binding protein SusD [Niabella ginsenosidivorans]|uniref:Carbohydrate-binding protein SusD n=1 Tax=Niabella ginsenosidivorans TaxID=1176587 RepID=A0A1A9I935_9BACT|nr:RagB/SusD family nutrient uptake outer membrane protein [Niabella ginsenosidivorans]ANH84106.1 carbohydrate-binding protein SusD [Niabella ginsenosidivorans]